MDRRVHSGSVARTKRQAEEADVANLGDLKSEIVASLMDSYGDHRKRKASDAEQSSPSPPTNRCPSTSLSSMCQPFRAQSGAVVRPGGFGREAVAGSRSDCTGVYG